MHIGIAAPGKKGFCDNNRKGMNMKTKRHIVTTNLEQSTYKPKLSM